VSIASIVIVVAIMLALIVMYVSSFWGLRMLAVSVVLVLALFALAAQLV
jgi:hypothetical protein